MSKFIPKIKPKDKKNNALEKGRSLFKNGNLNFEKSLSVATRTFTGARDKNNFGGEENSSERSERIFSPEKIIFSNRIKKTLKGSFVEANVR